MERHRAQLRLLHQMTHQGHAEAIGQPGFARAGRALEDQVLLVAQAEQDALQLAGGQEAAIGQDVIDALGREGNDRLHHWGGVDPIDGRLVVC